MLKCAKAYLVIVALASPWAADAAGLGRLTVTSVQGQPFKAEIDLVAVKKEEKPLLTARLASKDTFRQASVDYLPVLSTFHATIETNVNGLPYVRIVSSQAVSEPLLNILVELNWRSGRLLREYTVVLPHAENDVSTAARQAGTSSATGSAGVKPIVEKSHAPEPHEVKHLPMADSDSYSPVKPGDTLAGIAKSVVAPRGASMNQVLVALHQANPGAFIGNNIHQLKAGATLRIPDGNEIEAINSVEANKVVKLQTADWRQRRLGPVAEVTEELKQTVTGAIERTIESDFASAREPAREVLRLSQGIKPQNQDREPASHAGNAGEKGPPQHPGAQGQLQAMEEDAIARDRALLEANERIALLEKNIKELQGLLELKNLALAEMQKRAESIQTGPRDLLADPEAIQHRLQPDHIAEGGSEPLPQLSSINAQANSPEETPAAQTARSEPVELAKPARSVNTTHEAGLSNAKASTRGKVSFFDDLMANFEYLGGALVLLLTGIVGVSMVRGSRSSSIFDFEDDGRAGVPAHQPQESADSSVVRSEANAVGNTDVPALAPDVKTDLLSVSLTTVEARLGTTAKPQLAEPEPERDAHWYEIVTKLDLARAYQEMGDKESARQILQEVVQEGNERQREHASAVLKTL